MPANGSLFCTQAAIACAQEAGKRQQEGAAELRACREAAERDLAAAKAAAAGELRRLRAEADATHRMLQARPLQITKPCHCMTVVQNQPRGGAAAAVSGSGSDAPHAAGRQ